MPSKLVAAPLPADVFKPDIFKGKVLFCTGGGSGIGKAMAEAVMRHGANATIVGRQLERLTEAARELSKATGQTCIPAQADVRQPQQLKDAVTKTIEHFGRIDFVICGAAGNFLASIDGMSENAFKTVVEIDTLGTFNTIKATLPHVRAAHGAYIHLSATLHGRGTPYQGHVSAAKAGVDALSAVLAVEEGPRGVRSNVIAPGPIANTEGLSRLSNQAPSSPGTFFPYPLGRVGEVQDIASVGVFLLSDAASYITGQVLLVDGGWEHLRTSQLPYPQAVLDPDAVKHMVKPRL
ncbi:hypothetical protein SCLCIDRAFT_1220258 [Scleroderma citrinum Foug A]|uniref:2,4-dienoyl-CoA reductase [(3E)-enoyl-CoA-producing] n=1 Tax=Scleroderma citrinum Foug A TaxID=1036808 RepID=A0A0C3DJR2_9AGAM|nr:hypothetical protein SCLCIDRAFT_1220258 [Scleroderma citrinum Foug A]